MNIDVELRARYRTVVVDVGLEFAENVDAGSNDGSTTEGDPDVTGIVVGQEHVVSGEVGVAEGKSHDLTDGDVLELAARQRAEVVDGVDRDDE